MKIKLSLILFTGLLLVGCQEDTVEKVTVETTAPQEEFKESETVLGEADFIEEDIIKESTPQEY